MASICQDCDLARMSVGNKPQCLKEWNEKKTIESCPNFIHHKCRSCLNFASCEYVLAQGKKKDPRNFSFIRKVLKTSRRTLLIAECNNYAFVANKPRGKVRGAASICKCLFETICEKERADSSIITSDFK